MSKDPTNPAPNGFCTYGECKAPAVKKFPFCLDHMHRGHPCKVEGCPETVAAYNKSGYCQPHRWIPYKLKRLARTEWREK